MRGVSRIWMTGEAVRGKCLGWLMTGVVTSALLAGCSGALEGKKIDYKSAGKAPPLEVPPDLAPPTTTGTRYVVPEPARSGTGQADPKVRKGTDASAVAAIPAAEKVRMDRAGTQRWLVVKGAPEQVWPVVKEFWQESGFIISTEDTQAGWMETDWAENRAKIPVGGLTGAINKALDAVASLPERDKFRSRLERGAEPDTTEVYVSHKGMAEVYYKERENNTKWQVRPSDPELEAVMLSRLALRFGVDDGQVRAIAKAADAQPPRAKVAKTGPLSVVALAEPFDRAWRRVGLALDRVGFMVEDRNRAEGIYFVRYQDPEAQAPKRKGVSRLAFWRSDDKPGPEQYRVTVAAQGTGTEVRVLSKDGVPDQGETAKRILGLLAEQLR